MPVPSMGYDFLTPDYGLVLPMLALSPKRFCVLWDVVDLNKAKFIGVLVY